jgi:DNA-binding LytR/AlgR family response regulator
MNCIIIGEGPGSQALPALIARAPELEINARCANILTAQSQGSDLETAEIVFAEPGIAWKQERELLQALCIRKSVIVVATTPQFAVEAFELGAVDYLLHPFPFSRLMKACEKTGKTSAVQMASNACDYFFVKSDNHFERINLNEILYIESLQNYIVIQTSTKKVITYSSLKSIESYLSKTDFLRVQRSFLISIARVEQVSSEDVVIGNTKIPISRGIRDAVLKTILDNRLYQFQC